MWLTLLITLLLECFGLTTLLRFIFTITVVHGDSMFPILVEGDRLLTLNFLPNLFLRKNQVVICDIEKLHNFIPSDMFIDIPAIVSDNGHLNIDSDYSPINKLELQENSSINYILENYDEIIDGKLTLESDHSKFVKRVIGLPEDTICIPLSSLHEFMQTMLRSRCNAEGNLVWTVPKNHFFVRGDGLISMDSLVLGPLPLSILTGVVVCKLPRRLDPNFIVATSENE